MLFSLAIYFEVHTNLFLTDKLLYLFYNLLVSVPLSTYLLDIIDLYDMLSYVIYFTLYFFSAESNKQEWNMKYVEMRSDVI
jgi:hypothetical protein